MGHVAITARQPIASAATTTASLAARLSDWVQENIAGARLPDPLPTGQRAAPLGGRRRRLKACASTRSGPRFNITNTQVESLDDLLAAYERVIAHGFHMQWSVGQHTNDRELSFYCVTPSGFEWELGWNPIVVTPDLEEHWAPRNARLDLHLQGHTPIGGRVRP
ncbi:MAG: VOC family protein [Dermatophilaceae bacterium]